MEKEVFINNAQRRGLDQQHEQQPNEREIKWSASLWGNHNNQHSGAYRPCLTSSLSAAAPKPNEPTPTGARLLSRDCVVCAAPDTADREAGERGCASADACVNEDDCPLTSRSCTTTTKQTTSNLASDQQQQCHTPFARQQTQT